MTARLRRVLTPLVPSYAATCCILNNIASLSLTSQSNMASDAAPAKPDASAVKPDKPSNSPQAPSPDAKPAAGASKPRQQSQQPASASDSKPAANKNSNVSGDAKSQDKKPTEKTPPTPPPAKQQNPKPAGDE